MSSISSMNAESLKKNAAESAKAAKERKLPLGQTRSSWAVPKDILQRIAKYKGFDTTDKAKIIDILNNEPNTWNMLQNIHEIFLEYDDGDDGSEEKHHPGSLRTIMLDLVKSLPGKTVVIRAGRSSKKRSGKSEQSCTSNLAQNNKLTSFCLALDEWMGGVIMVPEIISGVAGAGKRENERGTEEHAIFERVCKVVPRYVSACKDKEIWVLYTDVQRLSRLPDITIGRRRHLNELGATVKFGEQFAEKEEDMDVYLGEWRKDLDDYNSEKNIPNSEDCAIGLRSKPFYIQQHLDTHKEIVDGAKIIKEKTLQLCTTADGRVYMPRQGTEELKFWENADALGKTCITNREISMNKWNDTTDTIKDDPSPSKIVSEADAFCKEVQKSNDMGNQDILLYYNRETQIVQAGVRQATRQEIDIDGTRHALHQISLARSYVKRVFDKPSDKVAIVTLHRSRHGWQHKDIAQLATSIALKNHSDVVMTLTPRLSRNKPLVMFIHRCCVNTGTGFHLSLGYGLAISDVADAEESRESGAVTNFTAKEYKSKEGIEVWVKAASGLKKVNLAEEDDTKPAAKKKTTVAADEQTKPAAIVTKKQIVRVKKSKPLENSDLSALAAVVASAEVNPTGHIEVDDILFNEAKREGYSDFFINLQIREAADKKEPAAAKKTSEEEINASCSKSTTPAAVKPNMVSTKRKASQMNARAMDDSSDDEFDTKMPAPKKQPSLGSDDEEVVDTKKAQRAPKKNKGRSVLDSDSSDDEVVH